MQTYIALFRGINVGGKNLLPMKELTAILQRLGCSEVKTCLQSGNAVFRIQAEKAAQLVGDIGTAVKQRFGFLPQILLLTPQDLEIAVAANPFPEFCNTGNTLHLFFLAKSVTNPNLQKLAALQDTSEQFSLRGRVFYLYAPDGIARSKLASGVEKTLGVATTARNWNTVSKVLELVRHT